MNISRLTYRLRHREDGAALTEFVITLPIFLAFFGIIYSLSGLVHGVLQTHVDAAPQMWADTYAAEDEAMRMSPRSQAWQGNVDLSPSGALDLWNNLENAAGGHWGESYGAVSRDMPSLTGQTTPHETAYGREIHVTDNPRDVIGKSRAAMGVSDDALDLFGGFNLSDLGGLFSGGGFGANASSALFQGIAAELMSAAGFHLGLGAGIRYGTVETTHEHSVTGLGWGIPDTTWDVSYTNRVSPSPDSGVSIPVVNHWLDDPETRAWAVSRVWVETEDPYAQLFNIAGSSGNNRLNPWASSEVPLVYDDQGANPDNPWWCLWC